MKINVNDTVRVRLTPFGESVLARHRLQEYEGLREAFPERPERDGQSAPCHERALLDVWTDHERDAEGMRTFQIYELMEIFGPEMSFTAQQMPFQDNRIVLEAKD